MTVDSKKKFIIDIAFIALIAVIVYFILKYLLIWLLPFVIGLLCALVLQRPVAFLTKKTPVPRAVWSVILVVVLLSGVFCALGVLTYRIIDEFATFTKSMSDSLPAFLESLKSIGARFTGWLTTLPADFSDSLRSAPSTLLSSAISFLSSFASTTASTIITGAPNILLTFVISIVACCFITASYNDIVTFVLRQLSNKNRQLVIKVKNLLMENILKLLRSYLLIMLITFTELFLGFILIGVDYAAVLAIIIAILDILPVLGTGTVLIPWAVVQLLFGNVALGAELLILYAVITVIRNIIEPKIVGDQVGLPAIVTLASMYVGLNLFGFIGLFGLPITLIILVKLQEAGLIHLWKTGPAVPDSSELSRSDKTIE